MKGIRQRLESKGQRVKAIGQRIKDKTVEHISLFFLYALCPMRYAIYSLLFLYALCPMLYASGIGYAQQGPVDDIKSSFYRANFFYEQANYDEVIKQYNNILESGLESGNLYYNLGNSYFKKGNLGKAILYYEKARRLIPVDRDLESNYEYARSLIKGSMIVSKKNWFVKGLDNFFEKFSIDGLMIFLFAFYVLILSTILISAFFKSFKKHALVLFIFLGLFFIAGFIRLKDKIALLNKQAIIVAEHADVRFEPKDFATTHFTLYEGIKVEVMTSKDNWYKVKRWDNKSGWVQNDTLIVF